MLAPKRTKFRKMQKGRNRGLAERGSSVSFGEYGLQVPPVAAASRRARSRPVAARSRAA
jgi:large subunit ribosomal protein L16